MSKRRAPGEERGLQQRRLDTLPAAALGSDALAVAHEDVLVLRLFVHLAEAGSRVSPAYAASLWLGCVRWAFVSPSLRQWVAACCTAGAEASSSVADQVFPLQCRDALASLVVQEGCRCGGGFAGSGACGLHAAPRSSYAFSASPEGARLYTQGGPFFLWFNPVDPLGTLEAQGGGSLSPSGSAHPLPAQYEANVRAWCGERQPFVLGGRACLAAVVEAASHPVFRLSSPGREGGVPAWAPCLPLPPSACDDEGEGLLFCDLLSSAATEQPAVSGLLSSYVAAARAGRWIECVDMSRLVLCWLHRVSLAAGAQARARLGRYISARGACLPLPDSAPLSGHCTLLYLDTDMGKGPDPLPPALFGGDEPLPPALLLPRDVDGVLQNNAIGSTVPAHPLLALALTAASLSLAEEGRVVHATGPALLTALFESFKQLPVTLLQLQDSGGGHQSEPVQPPGVGAALAAVGVPAAPPLVSWLRGIPKVVDLLPSSTSGSGCSDESQEAVGGGPPRRLRVPLGSLVHVCPAACFYATHWHGEGQGQRDAVPDGHLRAGDTPQGGAPATVVPAGGPAGRLPRYGAHSWDCTWGRGFAAAGAYLHPYLATAGLHHHAYLSARQADHPYLLTSVEGGADSGVALVLRHPYLQPLALLPWAHGGPSAKIETPAAAPVLSAPPAVGTASHSIDESPPQPCVSDDSPTAGEEGGYTESGGEEEGEDGGEAAAARDEGGSSSPASGLSTGVNEEPPPPPPPPAAQPPRPSLLHIPPILHDLYGLVFGCSPLAANGAAHATAAAASPSSPAPQSPPTPAPPQPPPQLRWVVEVAPPPPPVAWAAPPVYVSPRSAAVVEAPPPATRLVLQPYLSRPAVLQAIAAPGVPAGGAQAARDPRDVFDIAGTACAVLTRLWGAPAACNLFHGLMTQPAAVVAGARPAPAAAAQQDSAFTSGLVDRPQNT